VTDPGNCSVAVELARYIEWFLTSVQADDEVQSHLMVPVSSTVAKRIRATVLEGMTCDGYLLMDLVRHQKYLEQESLKTWKLPVQIAAPLIAVIILLLIAYVIFQKVQYVHMLDRDTWKINFSDIDFVVPTKHHRTMGTASNVEEMPLSPENCLGHWNNYDVVTRPMTIACVFDVNRKLKQTLMRMREEIAHENIARFFGIASKNDAVYVVEQYCANGTLVDFLCNRKYCIRQSIRYLLCADIANGMAYLHRQNLIHGNLSIDKCHVDLRWTMKIVDWECTALYDVIRRTNPRQAQATRDKSVLHFLCSEGSRPFRHLAPEIQKNDRLLEPTRAGDVYSFGVIIRDVFVDLTHTAVNVNDRMQTKALQFEELACHAIAAKRPTFEQLEKGVRRVAVKNGKTNLMVRCVHQEILLVKLRKELGNK